MAAILATVDIEDLATPKVTGIKDALSDLTRSAEQFMRTMSGFAGSTQAGADALGAATAQTRQATQGFREVQQAVNALTPQLTGLGSAIEAFLVSLADEARLLAQNLQSIQLLSQGLAALAQTLQAGSQATQLQANALKELAHAASEGNGFTAEQARILAELNDHIAKGLPLTEQQVKDFRDLAEGYTLANKEATGYDSALQLVLQHHRDAQAQLQQMAAGMNAFTQSLQEGEQVTQLQKKAFEEMAIAVQGLAQFTEEDKQAFALFNATLQQTTALTADQIAEAQRLNQVTQEAVSGTQEQVSAIQELINAEREKLTLSRQAAEAAKILENQMKEGEEATGVQVAAIRELNDGMKDQRGVTETAREAMEGLSYSLDIGQRITAKHVTQLRQASQGLQEVAGVIPPVASGFDLIRLRMAAMATVLGTLTAGFFAYLKSATDISAKTEVLGTVMEAVGKNATQSTLDLMAAEQQIKKLGITTVEARNTVIQFAQSQLDVADASKIAAAAQDLAVVAGENSSQTVNRLTMAIQLQQPRLLRQVGIVTGLDSIYREFAKTVGKTVNQLDAQEKQQAFINKILAEASRVQGAYASAMEDAGKKAGSLQRLQEEMQRQIGDRLLPTYRKWIDLQTNLIKSWEGMSEGAKTFFTMLGTFITVLSAIATLLAGAKFTAWLTGIGSVAEMASKATKALGLGTGLAGAVANVASWFGVWGKVIAVVVAALTTAYVAWNYATDKNTDKLKEEQAALLGETDRIKDLTEQILTLRNQKKLSIDQEEQLAALQKELLKLAPSVHAAIQKEKTSYVEATKAVNDFNAAKQQTVQINIQEARAEQSRLRSELEKVQLQLNQAANEEFRLKQRNAAAGTTTSKELGAAHALVDTLRLQAKAAQDAYENQKKFADSIDPSVAQMGSLTNAYDRARRAQERFRETTGAAAGVEDRAVFQRLEMQIKRVADLRAMPVTLLDKDLLAAETDALLKLANDATDAMDKYDKEVEDRKKRIEAARKSTREQLAGTTPQMVAQFEVLNEELAKTTQGTQRYFDLLRLGADIIGKFNQQAEQVRKPFKALQVAADELKMVELDQDIKKWREEMNATATAFDQFTTDSLRSLREEAEETQRALTFSMEQERLDAMEQAAALEREAIQSVSDLRLTETEKAVVAEQRRVEEMERNIRREKNARELAFMEEEAQIRVKFDLLRREAAMRVDNFRQEAMLRRINLRDEFNALAARDPSKKAELDARLRNFEGEQDFFLAQMTQRKAIYETQLKAEEDYQLKLLDVRRQGAAENEALQKKSMETVRAMSAATIQQILRDADPLRILFKGVMEEAATVFASGFTRMLAGMKDWSEGFKDVWHSIRDSFFNIVDQMIQKWVQGFIAKLFMPGGRLGGLTGGMGIGDFGKLFGGLFGGGSLMGPIGSAAGGLIPAGSLTAAGTMTAATAMPANIGMYSQSAAGGATAGGAAGITLAGAASTVAGGGLAGYAVGSQFSTRTKGALAGAAAGAGTGAMIGTFIFPGIGTAVGAAIGGLAGAIGGLIGGGKEAREVKKLREELIQTNGGIEALMAKAKAAGFELGKMLTTKKMKEFEVEVAKLNAAIQFGGMDELRKRAELVGFDLTKAFNAKNIEDFNKEMEHLNAVLAEQQKRLEALAVASQGLALRAEGFKESVAKDMQGIFDRLGTVAREALQKGYAAAQKRGFEGTQLEFMRQQLEKVAEGGFNNFKLPARAIEEYRKTIEHAQEDFETLGTIAAATFAQILKETGDLNAAMQAIGPTLDTMIEQQDALGLESSETFRQLLNFRRVVKDNEDISKSISGITQVLKGLSDAGALTQDLFSAIGTDVSRQFDRLIGRGVDTQMALLMLQPTLQKLYEAQQKYGYVVDANTQRLLNQAKAQGLVGEKFKETNDKILDVLVAIGVALGATIPEGIDKTADRARRRFPEMEADVNALAYGRSPGGIAGITEELERAQAQLDTFHTAAVGNLRDTERAIDSTAGALTTLSAPGDLGTNVTDLSQWIRDHQPQQIDPATGLPVAPVPVGGDEEPGATVGESGQVVINMPITIDASALDGQDMARVFHDQIVPQLKTDLDRNTAQLAAYMEQRLVRYRTSSTAVIRTRAPRT